MKKDSRLIVTCGDPCGCGPQIITDALLRLNPLPKNIYIAGDAAIFERIHDYKKLSQKITLIDAGVKNIEKIKPGLPTAAGGQRALLYLRTAIAFMKNFGIKRLATAPVSKETIQIVDKKFCGHTEYLAQNFDNPRVEMMMVSPKIKTVLFTRHISLAKVTKQINTRKLRCSIELILKTLKNSFGIKTPRIALLSVNPHAGVHTFLGKEEKAILRAAKDFPVNVEGPLPSDTAFIPANLKKYDCFICMYHDQGMIPFKLLAFKNGVNFTAGLPIVRTSPAHGTAFDLMKKGEKPNCSSMLEAIKLALKIPLC